MMADGDVFADVGSIEELFPGLEDSGDLAGIMDLVPPVSGGGAPEDVPWPDDGSGILLGGLGDFHMAEGLSDDNGSGGGGGGNGSEDSLNDLFSGVDITGLADLLGGLGQVGKGSSGGNDSQLGNDSTSVIDQIINTFHKELDPDGEGTQSLYLSLVRGSSGMSAIEVKEFNSASLITVLRLRLDGRRRLHGQLRHSVRHPEQEGDADGAELLHRHPGHLGHILHRHHANHAMGNREASSHTILEARI